MQNKVDHFNRILGSNVKGANGIVVREAQNNDPAVVQVQLNGAATPFKVICHRSYVTITQENLAHPEIWAGKDYGSAALRIAKLLNAKVAA
jgi:hypothetical protein